MKRTVKCPQGKESRPRRVLTRDEQKAFLETAYGTSNYNQYAFLLQTGLRTGEMIGLKWSDIDFNSGIISISRSMEYRHSVKKWRIGPTKSKSGVREIPMTAECKRILLDQKRKVKELKTVNLQFADFVFHLDIPMQLDV
ncbi:MAG: site-specific integrase [Eubacteriales bacterium]|nr:site-specific integrase [Eubacteriales bacterium]